MRVLGVDAGSRKVGFALVDVSGKDYRLDEVGVIRLDLVPYTNMPLPQRLSELYPMMTALGQRLRADFAVVEKIRVRGGGKNLDAYIASARSMQTVELALSQSGIEVVEALAVQTRSIMKVGGSSRAVQKRRAIALVNKIYADRLPALGYPKGLRMNPEGPDADIADAVLMAVAGDRLRARTDEFAEE